MQEIIGGYSEVTLRDGRIGNYQVARQFYQDFSRLATEHPDAFQQFVRHLRSDTSLDQLSDTCAQACRDIGLLYHHASATGTLQWRRPVEELQEFAKLAIDVKPAGLLSKLFGLSATPSYKICSPFKNPSAAAPDQVEPKNLRAIIMDWMGSDTRQYPGYRLIP